MCVCVCVCVCVCNTKIITLFYICFCLHHPYEFSFMPLWLCKWDSISKLCIKRRKCLWCKEVKVYSDRIQNVRQRKQDDRHVPARKMSSQASKEELRQRRRQKGSDCVSVLTERERPFEDDAFDWCEEMRSVGRQERVLLWPDGSLRWRTDSQIGW